MSLRKSCKLDFLWLLIASRESFLSFGFCSLSADVIQDNKERFLQQVELDNDLATDLRIYCCCHL
ncbi:MAG: hypothetical protein F6K24_04340 [Okeania sp. SIO2D1]|nr:hypothetical protein [Okeania sp. SIO2D1]